MKNIFNAKIISLDEALKLLEEVKWKYLEFQQKRR
jgi:hypothetical protein